MTLAIGTLAQVRQEVKTLIETVGKEGGYIMDASAIMQNDTTPENMRALVEATREFGGYDNPDKLDEPLRVAPETITRTSGLPSKAGHHGRVRLVGGAQGRAAGADPRQRGAGAARVAGGGRQRRDVHLADAACSDRALEPLAY